MSERGYEVVFPTAARFFVTFGRLFKVEAPREHNPFAVTPVFFWQEGWQTWAVASRLMRNISTWKKNPIVVQQVYFNKKNRKISKSNKP
jgi:hypothetical protein